VEIVLRWGDTLLEVIRAEHFALDDVPLVSHGAPIAAPCGIVGPIAYELRAASAVEPLPAPRRDLRALPYLGAAAVVHVAAVMWALSTPAPTPHASVESHRAPHRARIAPAAGVRVEGADDVGHAAQGRGRAMDGDAGARGAPIVQPPAGHIAIANIGETPQLAREVAIERARHAGILGSTQISPDAFASLVGHDPVTSGFDEHSAEAARLDTAGLGGGFGFGRSGFGSGGGGTIGTNSRGTIGTAHSDGTSFGHGWGGRGDMRSPESWSSWQGGDYGSMPNHRFHRPLHDLDICDGAVRELCSVTGALEPAIVRRYVRRNYEKLSYCFEKYQLGHPEEHNRTVVVEMELDTTVQNATVRGQPDEILTCIADTVKAIAFPKGATHATYYLRYHP